MFYFIFCIICVIIIFVALKKLEQDNQAMDKHYNDLDPDTQCKLSIQKTASGIAKICLVYCIILLPFIFIFYVCLL